MMKLKDVFKKLFKRGKVNEFQPTPHIQNKAIANKALSKMRGLQDELKAVDAGFDRAIADKEREYLTASNQYEDAYNNYIDLFKQQRRGIISKGKLNAEKDALQPFQESLQDIGAELDTIRGYKREEILSLLLSMQDQQDDYLKSKVDELTLQASELKRLKQEYQKKFIDYAEGSSEVFELEKEMTANLRNYGLNNQLAIGDKFTALMGAVGELPKALK